MWCIFVFDSSIAPFRAFCGLYYFLSRFLFGRSLCDQSAVCQSDFFLTVFSPPLYPCQVLSLLYHRSRTYPRAPNPHHYIPPFRDLLSLNF
jgi:hypothetical protein